MKRTGKRYAGYFLSKPHQPERMPPAPDEASPDPHLLNNIARAALIARR
jgi:hypothetical protein